MAQKKKDNDFKDGYTVLAGNQTPSREIGKDTTPEKKPKNNKQKRIVVRNVFLIILSVIMVIAGSGCLYYYHTLDSLNYSENGNFKDAGN